MFCLHRYRSTERYSFWGRDHGLKQFIEDHRSDLFVAHNAVAEQKFLMRLDVALPESWWDTMVGYRVLYNCPGHLDVSLIGVLTQLGLPTHISTVQKTDLRDQILNLEFNSDDPAERAKITNYCYDDCMACGLIYEKLHDQIDPATMKYWCRYLMAISKMELRGVPTDVRKAHLIWLAGADIADFLRTKVNSVTPVYTNTVLSKKLFLKWVDEAGIEWPWRPNPKGRLYQSIDDDTFKMMSHHHPLIELLRQVRKTISSLGNRSIRFDGVSGRHYFNTWAFGTITGRNSPSDFIFAGPKWCRHLIGPESPRHTNCYCDFKVQEFGIAGILSGDKMMQEMYMDDDDAHLRFAKMAGAVPPNGRREDYEPIRDIYKTVNLGALYWMTEHGMSERLGISPVEARTLLNRHQELFHTYWVWSRQVVQRAFDEGIIRTKWGWSCKVPKDSKFRTWANFPIQAAAGDIMRLFIIYLDQCNVRILAPVHDGFLLSCLKTEKPMLEAIMERARSLAVSQVLGDFPLKLDITWYDEKFDDRKGREVWGLIHTALLALHHV